VSAKTITIISSENKVGKTVICIELAEIFSRIYNKKVLLIDGNKNRGASRWLKNNLNCKKDFTNILKGETIQNTIYSNEIFDYIPFKESSISLEKFDIDDIRDLFILKNQLKKLKYKYDYILIDSTLNDESIAKITVTAADIALIPISVGIYAHEHLMKTNDFIGQISSHVNRTIRSIVIWKRYKNMDIFEKYIYEQVKAVIEEKNYVVLDAAIENDYMKLIKMAYESNSTLGNSKPSLEALRLFTQFVRIANELEKY